MGRGHAAAELDRTSRVRSRGDHSSTSRPARESKLPDLQSVYGAYEGVRCGVLRLDEVHGTMDVEYGRPRVLIKASIMDGGARAGKYAAEFYLDQQRRLAVCHGQLRLEMPYQGNGFMTAMLEHLEKPFRALGVHRVEVNTMDVGGYSWARAGYMFRNDLHRQDPEYQRLVGAVSARNLLLIYHDRIDELIAGGRISRSLADEFVNSFASDEQLVQGPPFPAPVFVTPAQIAMFGRDQSWQTLRGEMWLGKAVMLGSAWSGVRYLGDEQDDLGQPPETIVVGSDTQAALDLQPG